MLRKKSKRNEYIYIYFSLDRFKRNHLIFYDFHAWHLCTNVYQLACRVYVPALISNAIAMSEMCSTVCAYVRLWFFHSAILLLLLLCLFALTPASL